MEKLKKLQNLFPIAFANCKDVKSLIKSVILHALIPIAYVIAVIAAVTVIATVAGFIYLSALLVSYLLCFIIIGIPILFVVIIVYSLFMTLLSLASWAAVCVVPTVFLYSLSGTVLSVLAHIGIFGDIVIPEKKSKKAEDKAETAKTEV